MHNESGVVLFFLLWLNGTEMERWFDRSNNGFIVPIKPEAHFFGQAIKSNESRWKYQQMGRIIVTH